MRRFTVPALHDELDNLLRGRYPTILVEGEIAQRQTPASGHCYMLLRDRTARGDQQQISAIVWRDDWMRMRFQPADGERVIVRGRLGLHKGAIQIQVFEIAPAGEGALAREIEARKARLLAAGYLDPRRKRPIPKHPRFVGVATSLTGAALQDFLKVSRERYPSARILVAGCVVQGAEAAASVVRAMHLLVEDGRSDVVVVTRGGGSREDLLPFHDETLARFIGDCPIPVVSAVGHQIDTTIADLVADAVAPTPSAAAMLVLPDRVALAQGVDQRDRALKLAFGRLIRNLVQRVDGLRARLRHPRERLQIIRLRLIEAQRRLPAAFSRHAEARRVRLRQAERLGILLGRRIELARGRAAVATRLDPAMARVLSDRRRKLEALEARLAALSPLAVLSRGYAIVRGPTGVITDPAQAPAGERLEIRVAGGSFAARVDVPSRGPAQLSLLTPRR